MFLKKLPQLKKDNLQRTIKDRASLPSGRSGKIVIAKKEYINFSSNDYLGLSQHPYVLRAAKKAIDGFGAGAGASRLLLGGTSLHANLEKMIAAIKGTESALLFNSGYAANTGIIPAIAGEGDLILSDELNHASIIDGCRLSRAKTVIFRHKDIAGVERLLIKGVGLNRFVVTDGVFSMDGDIAPLKAIYSLCKKYKAMLYVDDAHGSGVLGNGKGTLEHFGLKPGKHILQVGTLSKAFGSLGAFAAGSKDAIEWILNNARSFIFSTALPPASVAASIAALEVIAKNPGIIKKLWKNREKIESGLKSLGFDIRPSETPIIPLRIGDLSVTIRMSEYLSKKGIYAPDIKPPTVKEPMIRLTVSAVHTDEHIERLLTAFKKLERSYGRG